MVMHPEGLAALDGCLNWWPTSWLLAIQPLFQYLKGLPIVFDIEIKVLVTMTKYRSVPTYLRGHPQVLSHKSTSLRLPHVGQVKTAELSKDIMLVGCSSAVQSHSPCPPGVMCLILVRMCGLLVVQLSGDTKDFLRFSKSLTQSNCFNGNMF